MRTLFALAGSLLGMVLLVGAPSTAGAAVATTYESWRALDDGAIALQSTIGASADGSRTTTLVVQPLDGKLASKGKPIAVYDGPLVFATLAVRPGAAAVALFRRGTAPFAKIALIDLAKGTSHVVDLARTAPEGYVPMSAVACADEDGFTVLWQEQKFGSFDGEPHATMARVRADGTAVTKASQVAIPWSLGAIVDDGRGYTLAVRYDGQTADQTRICFVTLGRDGRPEQHPWWGARPTVVDEIQLVMIDGAPMAAYRAGAGGKSILAVAVDTAAGQWGKEAEASKDLAAKTPSAPFAVRARSSAIELVAR